MLTGLVIVIQEKSLKCQTYRITSGKEENEIPTHSTVS